MGWKQRYMDYTERERGGRLPALDGARVLFVLLIGAYHIWQQSWLAPVFSVGSVQISLDPLMRAGYIWVDAMLMLSGFLLYLPYAEAMEEGKRLPRVLPFYKKRLLRIVPSYDLCILIMLVFVALPRGIYRAADGTFNAWHMGRDLLAHVTFTHTLFTFSYMNTPLNGILWTLGVEMQFYLIFPLLGRLFCKRPIGCYTAMVLIAHLYCSWVGMLPNTTMYFNQLPAQMSVYANGMAAAGMYASLKRRMKEDKWTRALFTALTCVVLYALWMLVRMQASINGYENIRMGQMQRRYMMSLLTALFLLGILYGARPLRLLLGNRITRVLSEMSFQFYIWHQVFAVQLKNWGIPASLSDTPWMDGERSWQYLYTFLCFAGALAISALVTYAFERPIAQWGRKHAVSKSGRNNN